MINTDMNSQMDGREKKQTCILFVILIIIIVILIIFV